MRKLLRGLAVIVVALLLVAVVALLFGRHRLYSRPDWYRAKHLTAAQSEAAANSADQKMIAARSQIAEAYAAQTRAARANNAAQTQPGSAFTLDLTEDEINAWIPKWEGELGWKSKAAAYVKDPAIIFRKQEIILAGEVKKWNSIVSLHFVPTLADGKLQIKLTQVTAGTLPLPRASWDGYLQKLTSALSAKLPELQRKANIDQHGRANSAAVEAAMSELLLNTLNDQPAEAALFLPDQLGRSGSLPVKITDVTADDGTLSLSVEPMDAPQRTALLDELKEPTNVATAASR